MLNQTRNPFQILMRDEKSANTGAMENGEKQEGK